MTSLLLLAQEAFERATNPAYGVGVNDEHAARLAAVLGPEDVERFSSEVALLDDPAVLTSYGWAWVLEFAVGHEVALDRRLLTDLCQRWDEPALKALVIEAALNVAVADHPRSANEEWLEGVIEQAAPQLPDTSNNDVDPSSLDEAGSPPAVDTSSAEALLTALLVVGTAPALAAARQLHDRDWPGAVQLAEFVDARLEDSDRLGRTPWVALRR